jgi:hypothetical protein
MNTPDNLLEDGSELDLYQEIESLIKKNPWAWQSVCAVLGLTGGVIAPVLGAIVDIITWFTISKAISSRLNVLSIVFCALTLPLLTLGAFCLDSLDRKTPHLPQEAFRNDPTPILIIGRIAQQPVNHCLNRAGALTPQGQPASLAGYPTD